MLARWIGVSRWELERVPAWEIEQARVICAAEAEARRQRAGKAGAT